MDDNNKEGFNAFIVKYNCQDFILFLQLIGTKIFEECMVRISMEKEDSFFQLITNKIGPATKGLMWF